MRRTLRICAWALGGTLSLAVLLVGAVYIAGNTDRGRVMIENLTRHLTAGQVSLSGLAGSFPHELTLERLELSDARGVWLTAEKVTVSWSPLALLANRVQVAALHVGSIDMPRLPEPSPTSHSHEPSIPRIDVANMSVDLLKLGPQLAGMPASLVLRGNAHLRSVKDMVIDASAQRIDGAGAYELHLRFDPKRMDAALNLHEPAGGPLENLLQLPGLGALAATVNLSGPLAAERLDVSVDAGAFRGRAQGSFNLTALSADFDFAIDSPALAPRPDLAWQRASVHGRWHGSVKAPQADAHVELEGLQLPGGTQLATLNGELTAALGRATLHAVVGGLRIPGPRPQLLQDSPVTLDASLKLNEAARPLEVSATHRLFALRGTAETAAVSAGKRSATLELRLPDLTPLAAIGGQKVRGSALLKAQVQNDAASTRLSLDASAALVVGTEIWSGAVGDRATLQLSGALTDRAVTFDSLKFTGRTLVLTGSGDLSRPPPDVPNPNPAQLRARWDLNASDLKSVSPALAGTLKASGVLSGPITALAGTARLTSTLSVRDSQSGTLSADISFKGLPSAPSATIRAQGSLDGAPLQVDAAMERSSTGSLRALVHRADWKSAHVDGDITIAQAGAQSHGQLSLQIQQLEDLQHLIGVDVRGSVAGNVVLHSARGQTSAQLHLDAHDLAAGSLLGNAQLTAEGSTDALGFTLDLQVPKLHGAAASLSAKGAVNADERKITVASATATYRGQDARLLAPMQISLADGVSIDELKLGAQQAVLVFKGELSPTLDVTASLSKVGPTLVNVFMPGLLAAGTLEAHAKLQGSVATPTGEVRFTGTGLALSDDAAFGLPSLDVQARAELSGDTANIDARLAAGTLSHLIVVGKAPQSAEGALDLKINGNLDVGMINPLLEARGQHATGELQVDATVTGSVAEPQIGGTVNLTKGSVRDYGRGVSLTDISAAIVGSEGTLQIKSLNATAAPGTVSMVGTVGVLQPGVPLDLHITALHAQPIVSKLVTANLNAKLHVVGKARERLDVSGTVDLGRTLIGIPNSLPPNVAVLDVRRRGKAAPAASDKQLVIGLDVALTAPQEFLVQGRGLDAEMGGDMHLSGTTDSPYVTGGFDLQRGSVSVGGSKLSFTAGRVSFNGAGLKNKIDPTLDFTAQSTVVGVTAILHITGLADAPQFEFTSNPSQPQDEIMALLLFGTPVAQLSALQLAQVGATLAIMSGVGGDSGLNPLVKLQKSLGLDRLSVGAATSTNTGTGTENSGASIAAGRYISKRIYIEAKQNTTGTSQLEADVDLTKHLKLQTRLGNGTASVQGTTPENDPGSSVGLTYQFEY
jgi:translocation and assembly module TamB